MSTAVFVNIATDDLERSKAFYTALGCTINPDFTDDNGACIVWSDQNYFMVLRRDFFATFTEKTVADARTTAQAIIAISRESRDGVDDTVDAGLAAGGREPKEPQDYGFMFSRTLEDPDGNILEFLYMDPVAAEQGPEAWEAQQG